MEQGLLVLRIVCMNTSSMLANECNTDEALRRSRILHLLPNGFLIILDSPTLQVERPNVNLSIKHQDIIANYYLLLLFTFCFLLLDFKTFNSSLPDQLWCTKFAIGKKIILKALQRLTKLMICALLARRQDNITHITFCNVGWLQNVEAGIEIKLLLFVIVSLLPQPVKCDTFVHCWLKEAEMQMEFRDQRITALQHINPL